MRVLVTPLREDVLIYYVTHRSLTVTYGTIRKDMAAIKKWNDFLGSNPDSSNFRVLKCVLKGIRRFKGDRPVKLKAALTFGKIHRIAKFLDIAKFDNLVLVTSFFTAHNGLLRASEFCHTAGFHDRTLFIADLRILPSFRDCQFIKIRIKASKTDIFRESFFMMLAITEYTFCPVTLMLGMLAQCRITTAEDLIERENEFLFMFSNGQPITRNVAVRCVKFVTKSLKMVGDFSLISFRKGGATTLVSLNCPTHIIQIFGRWRSDAYRRYITITPWTVAKIQELMLSVSKPTWNFLRHL